MENTIPIKAGRWIQYQLKLAGTSQSSLAKIAGCSSAMITHFLNGNKGSERIRLALCKVLGYDSFESLVRAAMKQGGKAIE